MVRTSGVTLKRRVGEKVHRTHFRKYRATVASCVIAIWERAARMGINYELSYLFDQYI